MTNHATRHALVRFASILAVCAAIAVPLGCSDDDDPANPGGGGPFNGTVRVLASSFSPSSATIKVNDTVTWEFSGGPHTVTQGTSPGNPPSPLFNSGSQSSGTFTFTFDTPGTYQYFCEFHFGMGMTGTITVEP